MNPAVSAEYLDSERALLGEADFAREFEGVFTASGTRAFFTEEEYAAVFAAITPSNRQTGATAG